MLSKKKKEYLKGWLLERLSELLSEGKKPVEEISYLSDKFSEKIDQATLELDKGMAFHLKDRDRKFIRKIEISLDKLEKGTFGICEDCGKEISEKRLMARPVTSLCFECKRKQEASEKVRAFSC